MKKTIFLLVAIFGALFIVHPSLFAKQAERLAIQEDLGGDFTLKGDEEKAVSLHDFDGKVVLLNFGYTSCPDVCPVILTQLQQVTKKLGQQATGVQTIFVTVDPERDDPQHVADYVAHFNDAFVGLSGNASEINEVAKRYKVRYFKETHPSIEGYFMAHTDYVYLVDQKGRYRGKYKTRWALNDLIEDVQILLNTPES